MSCTLIFARSYTPRPSDDAYSTCPGSRMMMLTLGSASRARASSIFSELGRPVPDRDRALRLALVLDDVEQQPIDGDRIGAEHDLLRIEDVPGGSRERSAVPHAAQPVHDLQHRPRPQRLDRGERADERVGVRLAALVRARDVREAAVGDVLQAAGDAGRAVVLHVRDVDDLREPLRHEPHHVRPRVLFAEEIGLEVRGGIVAAVVGVAVGALGGDDLQRPRAGAARSCTRRAGSETARRRRSARRERRRPSSWRTVSATISYAEMQYGYPPQFTLMPTTSDGLEEAAPGIRGACRRRSARACPAPSSRARPRRWPVRWTCRRICPTSPR